MELWKAFWRLESPRRRLAAEAGVLLLVVRVGLHLCSYRRLHRALSVISSGTRIRRLSSRTQHADVAWAVICAGRRLPLHTTCLADALAADTMLRRRSHASRLWFGVRRPAGQSRIEAHAWVECEGDLVIGVVDGQQDYAPLTT